MHPDYKASERCFKLIEKFECYGDIGKCLTAYKCPAGKWTIGIGNTYYADYGNRVEEGDVLTKEEAIELFYDVIVTFENYVNRYVLSDINQNQFDALVSFVYNNKVESFKKSTLLKMVNSDPNNLDIHKEWMKWVYFTNPKTGKKEVSVGLENRRAAELGVYFL